MDTQSQKKTAKGSRLQLPGLGPALMLIVLAFSLVVGLGGLFVMGQSWLLPLAILLVAAFMFNFLLVWLDRRNVSGQVVLWAAHIGVLAFLTAAISLTGGFKSPFFVLYTAYLFIGSQRSGWRGMVRSLLLCFLSWVLLAFLRPPATLEEWAQTALLVSTVVAIALLVGVLAQRRVRLKRESERRNRELTFLREAGRSLGASLDSQEVLAETLSKVNELLDVEAASLALVNPVTDRITFELAIGGGNEAVVGVRLEPGEGIVGYVIQHGQPVLVADVAADTRWHAGVDQVSGYQTRSILCVPLRTKGQVIGAMEVLNKRDGPFTKHDQRLVSSLADLAAQSIENARLHDQIRQNIERLQDAYNEMQKLDNLKSAFIRNVSHELRTPLALIEGYLDLLLDGQLGPLRAEQRRSLALMAEKSSSLTRMVNDIISLQTIGTMGFDLEILSLANLAQMAVDDIRPRAQKARIELEFSYPEYLPRVQGDPRRLLQVFFHLLDNAIKFSPNGGTIRVILGQNGNMLWFCVQDEGIGLQTDQLERVFDRFYQVDGSATRSFGGTGLGLALVKEVVEAHGGAVLVESDGIAGKGSKFTVYLPAYGQPEA